MEPINRGLMTHISPLCLKRNVPLPSPSLTTIVRMAEPPPEDWLPIRKVSADQLRWLAEDWAEIQKWATKDAKDAEKAARSSWAREGKSEGLSSRVYTAAEAIVSESQDWADRAKKWTGDSTQMGNPTSSTRSQTSQALRDRGRPKLGQIGRRKRETRSTAPPSRGRTIDKP